MFWSTVLGAEHAPPPGAVRDPAPRSPAPLGTAPAHPPRPEQEGGAGLSATPTQGARLPPSQPPTASGVTARDNGSGKIGGGARSGKGGRRRSAAGRPVAQFHCPQCNAPFGQRSNLNKHVRTVHENQRPFQCDQCESALVIRTCSPNIFALRTTTSGRSFATDAVSRWAEEQSISTCANGAREQTQFRMRNLQTHVRA